jgi:hypothetical protein
MPANVPTTDDVNQIQQPEASAPLFDMSKAQPIQTSPPAQSAAKPLFDMSKATPVQPAQPNGDLGQIPRTGARGLLEGFGKQGVETVKGVKNLVNSGLGVVGLPTIPNSGIDAYNTDATTPSEKIGGVAENVAEFATGEEALKGVSWLQRLSKTPEVLEMMERYPKTAKILLGAAKAGTVGAAQGAAKGAAEGDATGGAIGGGLGGAIGGAGSEAAAPGLKALARIFGLGGLTGEEAMVKAGRPTVK